MKRRLVIGVWTVSLVLGCVQVAAHDDKMHKATVGEVAAATANGLDLRTKDGVIKVKYSSRTKFELEKKPASKSSVKVGDRVGVLGSKLPTGELMASEVMLGVPPPKPAAAKDANHKH